jgi:hypothetical protein
MVGCGSRSSRQVPSSTASATRPNRDPRAPHRRTEQLDLLMPERVVDLRDEPEFDGELWVEVVEFEQSQN